MAAFLGSIAFLFSVALLAWGFLVLSRRRAEEGTFTTVAAFILILGGLCGIVCNSYFYAKYYFDDQLDNAYPTRTMMSGSAMSGRGMQMQGMGGADKQQMMNMMMQDPEMMRMMHRMMHEQGAPMMEGDMPMEGEMPTRDRERMHQPDDDQDTDQ